MTKKTYYITTPIYYPSDKLHIGHSYCSVATDAISRFKRKTGCDVRFLTGTDEHGQKIERIAKQKGIEPLAYVDQIVAGIQDLWRMLDISYDDFLRTTEERHTKCVQKIFKKLYDQGDIYKGTYTGWYCTPCESFWLDRQLSDGCCPDCGRAVEKVEEESYFFRLSKYADRLIAHIQEHPEFIQPASRANEMMQNFLLPGLEDLSVSRTKMSWGIPVDFDPKHVVYVWLDALSNYISALGYGSDDDALFQKYWPADVHIVGKEIVRFHTIIWPILLMALDLPLPKQVFGHGWIILEGGKMSKSVGNVVDPVVLIERYGADAIRYFLLRDVTFGQDGLFSNEALLTRINSDLANDLGNLLSRTVAMIEKYTGGRIPAPQAPEDVDLVLEEQARGLSARVEVLMDELRIGDALGEIWKLIAACNKYIDVTMPWALAKDAQGMPRLNTVLYHLAECLRIAAGLIEPFLTRTAPRMYEQLGIEPGDLTSWEALGQFGLLRPDTLVRKGDALFPRIDLPKELEALAAVVQKGDQKPPEQKTEMAEPARETVPVSIEDFDKLDLRTGKVLACEAVEGADKLLKFTIQMGGEERVILSGIKKWYPDPAALAGKTVVLIANLKPRKIRGIVSHGMLLSAAAEDESVLSLLTTLEETGGGLQVR